MACEEAQELHGFGAEPAADLDADHNESTAPRALEFRVGLEALAPCSAAQCSARHAFATFWRFATPRKKIQKYCID